ncbi:hypothetical protein [Cryptosporangium minutisporangium]|uniref:Glycosyltransferase RgtA/B/C/D-like domain-containing protein n=1 Tax=Cryptosporangium minutisporangium TaxID=113569 RepID=A0ABP6T5V2_9ACTN
MTAQLPTAQSPSPEESPGPPWTEAALRPYALAVGAIAVVQGVVIGALGAAGYFYLDDVDFSADGAKHPLNWDYLTLPVNVHLTPGLRLVYWLIAHYAPYDNGATVLGRVLVQALATALMGYLLAQLAGPGRAATLGLGLYAFSPLLVPSLLSLSSGASLVPLHVGVLVLLVMHVRYEATRQLKYAVFGALGGWFALLFWEQAVLSFALAPLLTLLYLTAGGVRARLAAVLRSWPAWLLYAAPVVLFFGYFLHGPYGSSSSMPHPGDIWSLAWDGWLHALGPSLVGGPWTWFSIDNVYYSAAAPGLVVTVCGQLAALVLSVLAVYRNGFSALRAWILPATALFGTSILLAAGRFEFIGTFLARNFHYWTAASISLVLGVVLLTVRIDPAAVAARGRSGLWAADDPAPQSRIEVVKPISAGLALVVAAYAVSYGTTIGRFEHRWVQNPIRGYLTTAIDDLRATTASGPIAIYDNYAPVTVATLIQGNRRVSEIFRPVEHELPNDIAWDDVALPLYLFGPEGDLVKARFVEEASSVDKPGVFCPHPLRGVGSVTMKLDKAVTRWDSFARLDYLAQTPTEVTVRLANENTTFAPRRNGTPVLTAGAYRSLLLGTPNRGFDRVVVSSVNPDAVVCVSVKAGSPVPAL